jgi:hypothetical protein
MNVESPHVSQFLHDQSDTLDVPPLHGLVIRTESRTQTPPREQMAVGNWMNQTSRPNDPP